MQHMQRDSEWVVSIVNFIDRLQSAEECERVYLIIL